MRNKEDYWREYYTDYGKREVPWLDYSNAGVQAQSLAAAMEAVGPVLGCRCLDVGCGNGQLSRMLLDMGASAVTALDISKPLIEANQLRTPAVNWVCGSPSSIILEGKFDRILLVEVLQYLELETVLQKLWRETNPGGLVTAIVPNGECPIVQRARDRFDSNYEAPGPAQLASAVRSLEAVEGAWIRGFFFQENQAISPYRATGWEIEPRWESPPNRLQIVVIKAK